MAKTILIVDDEKTIRWSLGEALRDSGYEVIDADRAESGVATFRDRSPESATKPTSTPARRSAPT